MGKGIITIAIFRTEKVDKIAQSAISRSNAEDAIGSLEHCDDAGIGVSILSSQERSGKKGSPTRCGYSYRTVAFDRRRSANRLAGADTCVKASC